MQKGIIGKKLGMTQVFDEKGKCGEGSHLRIMVAPKGIQEKAEGKQA